MPNWANNNISINGPKELIETVWNKATDNENQLLEAMVPIGEWDYGEAVAAWGTKWDVSTEGLEFTDNGDGTAEISGYFDSAWAPPIDAMQTFIENNDEVSITLYYEEPGMDFCGVWDNGDVSEAEMSTIVDKLIAEDELTSEEAMLYAEFEGSFDSMVEWKMEEDEEME